MRSSEIGSEFWDVPAADWSTCVFPEATQWFLSGRSALRAIVAELRGCRTVAMPSWCCDSMVKPFVDAGFEIRFYPVYWRNGLIQEPRLDSDVLFVMDYFGYTADAVDHADFTGVTIRDVTHSVFSSACSDADYCFGSLRKWCGVWTGGFAWTGDGRPLKMEQGDDHGYTSLRREGMVLKRSYIRGEGVADKGYLQVFDAAEEALEDVDVAPAAQRDVELALRIDAEAIRACRRANAEILRKAFPEWLMFPEMKETDCPMFVPILVPGGKRDALRQRLMQDGIYCPIHWPVSGYHRLDERAESIYRNELSLVCDQRYSREDMDRIVSVMNQFWKEA